MISLNIPWNIVLQDLENYTFNDVKMYIQQVILKLKEWTKYSDNKIFDIIQIEECIFITDLCLNRTWELLNSGHWKNVPLSYRYCYSLCSLLKTTLINFKINIEIDAEKKLKLLKEMVEQTDQGIILGAPLPNAPNCLTDIASKISEKYSEISQNENPVSGFQIDEEFSNTDLFDGFQPLREFFEPSMEKFYCELFKPKQPAVLKNCLRHWKALELWSNSGYLQKVAGTRTVPIEVGSRYTEEDWTQKLITFSEFLQKHVIEKNNETGYLAQHQLFEQIPELKKDFNIPDYCSFFDDENSEESPDINAWFGPGGTVSPLHYDPKNNLLCQVFGYKRIILYSPEDSPNVYPYETRLLLNTSKIDPYNPDYETFPNFRKAIGYMCILKPGDMLYIPPKWWHHVASLSPSFSISFWWS